MTKNASGRLLVLANFLAAVGGGSLLSMAMGVVRLDRFGVGTGTIVAFMIGSALGLALLFLIPERMKRVVIGWLSMTAMVMTIVLLAILWSQTGEDAIGATSISRISSWADEHRVQGVAAWMFFLVLCLRFAVWFIARALRSNAAAGGVHKLAWVELSYYLGMIVGLICWRLPFSVELFGFLSLGIGGALLLDAVLQASAGTLDFIEASQLKQTAGAAEAQASGSITRFDRASFARMTIAATALTTGIQIVFFAFFDFIGRTQWANKPVAQNAAYALAALYLGVAVSSVVCGALKPEFEWGKGGRRSAFVLVRNSGRSRRIPLNSLVLVAVLSMVLALVSFGVGHGFTRTVGQHSPSTGNSVAMLMFVILSGMAIEPFLIVVLGGMGQLARESNRDGMVAWAYGTMAFFGAVVLLLLVGSKAGYTTWIVSSAVCALVSVLAMRRRATPVS